MSDPIKSTLFRFATMRAPNAITDEAKERFFVQHPEIDRSRYAKLLAAGSTSAQWANEVQAINKEFKPLQSLTTIKGVSGERLYRFAAWLANNKTALHAGTVDISAAAEMVSEGLEFEALMTLWDNLFFYLLSNKQPALRDAILRILLANHVIVSVAAKQIKWEEFYKLKVVLPQNLFPVNAESGNTAETPVYTKALNEAIDNVLAKSEAKNLSVTISELKKAQEVYEQQISAAYNAARNQYESKIAQTTRENTAYDENEQDFKVKPFTSEIFSFEPAIEMDARLLNNLLSKQSLDLLNQYNVITASTFAEATKSLTQLLQERQAIVFKSKPTKINRFSIGGLVLSLPDTLLPASQQYAFLMRLLPLRSGGYKIYIAVNMGAPGADVAATVYHAVFGGTDNTNGTFNEQTFGNNIVLEFYPQGINLPAGANSLRLYGNISFTSGLVLQFDTSISTISGATGRMVPQRNVVMDNDTEALFIPSGYGVKRLGVADYRQVEQTTCCYVPGEVSHIENVMAKEYKERSTRRLHRSEVTETSETQTEKEALTDTTSTDRYELQQQVSEVINKDTSFSLSASASFGLKFASASVGSNFATHTSQQDSNSQAVTYAKDITQRAMDRVVQKVREERVSKIVDEFEEQNKHGFDNKEGNAHISGVYRWVDKLYKNQVYNYGKRLIYEFMVPQPGLFHLAAMQSVVNAPQGTMLQQPVDPRSLDLTDYRDITEATAAHWAAVYNAEIEAAPDALITVGKSFKLNTSESYKEAGAHADKIEVPEGYSATSAAVNMLFGFAPNGVESYNHVVIAVGDQLTPTIRKAINVAYRQKLYFENPIAKEVGVAAEAADLGGLSYSVTLNCQRTDEHYRQWQITAFNKIIDAYNDKMEAYNSALEKAKSAAPAQTMSPQFYRLVENTVLRKACIQYLLPAQGMGRGFVTGNTAATFTTDVSSAMDRYAALVKFMEQAFEWELMGYNFYPFYWGEQSDWQTAYQQNIDDALFRSFLQAGMARVVATVRPGFEEAVMHYMATGQIWNGGDTPVVGDDLHLSIIEELKNPTFYVEDTWETRVPTTLTLLQKGTIALNAEALPCDCGNANSGIEQLVIPDTRVGGIGPALPVMDEVPNEALSGR